MSVKQTITESELTAATEAVRPDTFINEVGARRLLTKLGITVVPDPIPEPEGDVIVVDQEGAKWMRNDVGGGWELPGFLTRSWLELVERRGPVKIYRLEES